MRTKNIFISGFTLIEVLVVIAIIGILSTVVLSASSSARVKAQDLAIKSNLDSIRTSAEFYFDKYHNYSQATSYGSSNCQDPIFLYEPINRAIVASESISSYALCMLGDTTGNNGNANSWAVSVPLKSNAQNSWCVDSSGFSNVAHASYDGFTNKAICSTS